MDEELHKKLLKKAAALLARKAYSRKEMELKLSKLAQSPQVEAAIDRLSQLNLLNDADYAYNFALCRIKYEGWGLARIRNALLRRHVAKDTVDSAIDRVRMEASEEDALAYYLQLCCRKAGAPANVKAVRKLFMRLLRRGFRIDAIYRELGKIVPDDLLHHINTGE
jgi:regulatory protein